MPETQTIKRKPLGEPRDLPEGESDEAATPNAQDQERAVALAQASGSTLAVDLLNAELW